MIEIYYKVEVEVGIKGSGRWVVADSRKFETEGAAVIHMEVLNGSFLTTVPHRVVRITKEVM